VIVLPPWLFEAPLPGLGRPLAQSEGVLVVKYLEILSKWQKTHRLVGSTEPGWMIENVLLDSLTFLGAIPPDPTNVVDVGSGAGIPGVPIAIVRPQIEVRLIESRQRRASFLSAVVRELPLNRVAVVSARAEALGAGYVGGFDVAVLRCAARVGSVLPIAMRLVRLGGAVVVAAGPRLPGPESHGGVILTVNVGGASRTFHRYIKH
jgi:16S rRNA (guanine527-N7)-methyltransferase